ncbi:MAG: hypothetical protein ABI595_13150 [Actinomycetota bacterium]
MRCGEYPHADRHDAGGEGVDFVPVRLGPIEVDNEVSDPDVESIQISPRLLPEHDQTLYIARSGRRR